jgi:hypothetical protein
VAGNVELEVQSSTVLSQVELCFVCPEFIFFFAKSRSIPDACSICAIGSPSCKYTAGYVSSLFFC